jgi:hypothetical protein
MQTITLNPPSMTAAAARAIVGSLSKPSKMPCYGYSIPAERCITGAKLAKVEGSTCSRCYALRGHYRFSNVKAALQRRLKAFNDALFVPAMALLIRLEGCEYFRWMDSGDIQSVGMLRKIVQIAELTPSCRHWLPTRELGIVRKYFEIYGELPSNLTLRVSAHMMDAAPPKGFANTSTVHQQHQPHGYRCPAPDNGNRCGSCRACWQREVVNVSYGAH